MSNTRGMIAAAVIAVGSLAAGCGTQQPNAGPSAQSPSTQPATSGTPTGTRATSPSCRTGRNLAAPNGALLNAVQFVSPSTGWVVGLDRIMRTTDGGQHWVIQYRTTSAAQLSGLDFVDAEHGWVVGGKSILATADGGAHWTSLPETCPDLLSVHFISPQIGFGIAGAAAPYARPLTPGVLFRTSDGGRTWSPMPSPVNAQSVCFTSAQHGWLGANGRIYGTADGGHSWHLAVRDPFAQQGLHSDAELQCAGPTAAWAVIIGAGVGMSHQEWIGYHSYGGSWSPIFADQYFAPFGVRVRADSPGPETGPFSAISADQAAFFGWCGPCSPTGQPGPNGATLAGSAPLDLAQNGGASLLTRKPPLQLSQATGAAFLSVEDGWVVGNADTYYSNSDKFTTATLILHTTDGGLTWQVQYRLNGR